MSYIPTSPIKYQSFNWASPTGGSGTFYTGGGFYDAPTTSVTLSQASPTVTYGTAGVAHQTHVFIVASAAGTASGGTGAVEIEVSGTTVDESGTETTSDTEVIVADITTMSTNAYYETVKLFTGQVTITIQNASGSTQTTFSATVNYGFAAYEDFGNRQFTLDQIKVVGRAGANDTGFNLELIHHQSTGWTYAASGFVPGPAPLATWTNFFTTDNNLANGENFRGKFIDIGELIAGNGSEGLLVRVTTSANNAVETMDLAYGVKY